MWCRSRARARGGARAGSLNKQGRRQKAQLPKINPVAMRGARFTSMPERERPNAWVEAASSALTEQVDNSARRCCKAPRLAVGGTLQGLFSRHAQRWSNCVPARAIAAQQPYADSVRPKPPVCLHVCFCRHKPSLHLCTRAPAVGESAIATRTGVGSEGSPRRAEPCSSSRG